MCSTGFLVGVRMRMEQPWEAERDKSAANNLAMECENGKRMIGDGTDRGRWGEWQRCPRGECDLYALLFLLLLATRAGLLQGDWQRCPPL